MARYIGIIAPPQHCFAAGLVRASRAARYRHAQVHGELPCGDVRIHAVPHNPPAFVLVESQIDVRAKEIARLRVSARQRPFDLLRHRICRAAVVLIVVAQEGIQIARSREAACTSPSR